MRDKKQLLNFKNKVVISVTFEFIFLVCIVFLFIVIMSEISIESKSLFTTVIEGLGQGFLGYVVRGVQDNYEAQRANLEPYYQEQNYQQSFRYGRDLLSQKQQLEEELARINEQLI